MSARVLVVDDDPWILRMVTASLRKKGLVVDTAREGRQALERVRAHPPDVIITDVMMPVMDGWALVQQLRQDPRLAAIPVIFLTALGKDQARLRQLGLGDQDYLAKPFRFEDLDKRVDAALASRGLSPAMPSYGPSQGSGPHGYPQPPALTHNSGVHPMPGYPQPPPGPTEYSGVHPMPGYPQPPPGPTHNSGVHAMPLPPYGYPQQGQYPGQYPPQPGQYPPQPGQYPPQPGQYPPQYGYPGQYPPQPQYGYPGQYPPQPQYPAPPPAAAPPVAAPPAAGKQPPPPPPPGAVAARARRGTALNGKLEQLGLSSLLVMMEMERKQGVLSISTEDEAVGRVYLRGGQVVAAEIEDQPNLPGRECVYRMLGWKAGLFSFSATTVEVEDSVQSSTTHLLMEGARLIDEAERDYEGL
jgi:CheY-like chemotaxis protein